MQPFASDGCALGSHVVQSFKLADPKGRFASATIYHPEQGDNLSSVVLVGGFGCGDKSLAAWAPSYASHGIVAMTIGTLKPWRDMPNDRSMALLDAVKALRAEHTRSGSAINGRLEVARVAVQGWSLGGGGCQLAVMADPTLKCAIAICPHSGPGMPAQLSEAVPVLFIVGQADSIAPGQIHAWPQYRQTTAPKLLFEIKHGDHAVGNGPAGGSIQEAVGPCALCGVCKYLCGIYCGCSPCGTFNGATGHATTHAPNGAVGGMALAWLLLYLEGDMSVSSRLQMQPEISSSFEFCF